MIEKKNKSKIFRQFVICTIVVLLAVSFTSLAQTEYGLTVHTDQINYYSGEDVAISGRLRNTETGQGISDSEICVNVTDPNGTLIFYSCSLTKGDGHYIMNCSLVPNATMGTYQVDAKSTEYGVEASRTFELTTVICGDCNRDRSVDLGDVVKLVHIYKPGCSLPDPWCSGDVTGNGVVDLGDIVYLINYLFRGGPPPVDGCCD